MYHPRVSIFGPIYYWRRAMRFLCWGRRRRRMGWGGGGDGGEGEEEGGRR